MTIFKNLFNKFNEKSNKISIYLKEYLNYLIENKYKIGSIYHLIDDIQDFIRYIHVKGIKNLSKVSPTTIKQYLKYRSNIFKRKYKRSYKNPYQCSIIKNHIIKCMTYLSMKRIIKSKYLLKTPNDFITKVPSVFHKVIKEYIDLYLIQRGIKQTSLSVHKIWTVRFLNFIYNKGIKKIYSLTIDDIDKFIYKDISFKTNVFFNRGRNNCIKGALRSFCSFLYMYNYIEKDLSKDIVASKTYRHKTIPKHISYREILSILKAVDTTTIAGKRDYAILVLLANYGLRPFEITKLKLSDIDWTTNKIYIRNRKANKDLILPLIQDVSKAIKKYLKVRLQVNTEEIFVNLNAPHRQLSPAYISAIVSGYIKKIKLNTPIKGAYLFRHSLAKKLLDKGTNIVDIASILGHCCISSTMNYIRISIEQLKEIADNYANLL